MNKRALLPTEIRPELFLVTLVSPQLRLRHPQHYCSTLLLLPVMGSTLPSSHSPFTWHNSPWLLLLRKRQHTQTMAYVVFPDYLGENRKPVTAWCPQRASRSRYNSSQPIFSHSMLIRWWWRRWLQPLGLESSSTLPPSVCVLVGRIYMNELYTLVEDIYYNINLPWDQTH